MPDPEAYWGDFATGAIKFKAALEAGSASHATYSVRHYLREWRRFEKEIDSLAKKAKGMTQEEIEKFRRLTELQAQMTERLMELAPQVEGELSKSMADALTDAQVHAFNLTKESEKMAKGQEVVWGSWNLLGKEQVETLMGAIKGGSPLSKLLHQKYPVGTAMGVKNKFVEGMIKGLNPRTVARECAQAYSQVTSKLLTTVRTTYLQSYRLAAIQSYQRNSDVVTQWVRFAALDDRTCLACWLAHGKIYNLEDPPPFHPNDRCTVIPVTRSWTELFGEWGEGIPETTFARHLTGIKEPTWGIQEFKKLPADQQRQMLGPTRWKWYGQGKADLTDFFEVVPNQAWGPSLQVTPIWKIKQLKKITTDATPLWQQDIPQGLSKEDAGKWKFHKNLIQSMEDNPDIYLKHKSSQWLVDAKAKNIATLKSLKAKAGTIGGPKTPVTPAMTQEIWDEPAPKGLTSSGKKQWNKLADKAKESFKEDMAPMTVEEAAHIRKTLMDFKAQAEKNLQTVKLWLKEPPENLTPEQHKTWKEIAEAIQSADFDPSTQKIVIDANLDVLQSLYAQDAPQEVIKIHQEEPPWTAMTSDQKKAWKNLKGSLEQVESEYGSLTQLPAQVKSSVDTWLGQLRTIKHQAQKQITTDVTSYVGKTIPKGIEDPDKWSQLHLDIKYLKKKYGQNLEDAPAEIVTGVQEMEKTLYDMAMAAKVKGQQIQYQPKPENLKGQASALWEKQVQVMRQNEGLENIKAQEKYVKAKTVLDTLKKHADGESPYIGLLKEVEPEDLSDDDWDKWSDAEIAINIIMEKFETGSLYQIPPESLAEVIQAHAEMKWLVTKYKGAAWELPLWKMPNPPKKLNSFDAKAWESSAKALQELEKVYGEALDPKQMTFSDMTAAKKAKDALSQLAHKAYKATPKYHEMYAPENLPPGWETEWEASQEEWYYYVNKWGEDPIAAAIEAGDDLAVQEMVNLSSHLESMVSGSAAKTIVTPSMEGLTAAPSDAPSDLWKDKEFDPVQWETGPEGDAVLRDRYKAYLDGLTPSEIGRLRSWSGSNYRWINNINRQIVNEGRGAVDPGHLDVVDTIQEALTRARAPDDFEVWHGMKAYGAVRELIDDDPEKLVGTVIGEEKFTATSTSAGRAYSFGGTDSRGRKLIGKLKIPKGAPGVYIAPISNHPSEYEFLLPKGCKFRVVGVEYVQEYNEWLFDLEYIGQSTEGPWYPNLKMTREAVTGEPD